jgi:hypothetical protein
VVGILTAVFAMAIPRTIILCRNDTFKTGRIAELVAVAQGERLPARACALWGLIPRSPFAAAIGDGGRQFGDPTIRGVGYILAHRTA